MLSELKRTRYVYHYTSLETLFAILGDYRKKNGKKELTLRASNIFRVNDPSEMESGYDRVKTYLYHYEEIKNIPKDLRLSEIYKEKAYEEKCKDDYINTIKGNTIELGLVPYIISLSGKRDFLPMWSLYGNQGKGVCLKFDTYDIINHLSYPLTLGFVSYDRVSGNNSLNEIIPQYYEMYLDNWHKDGDIPTIDEKITELSTLCFSISPFIKYKDYKYEKEFRMVYNMHYGPDFDDLPSKQLTFSLPVHEIKPYVDIPINAYSLKEIIMGPCLNWTVMKDVIIRETDSCRLNVRISNSKVPFRMK